MVYHRRRLRRNPEWNFASRYSFETLGVVAADAAGASLSPMRRATLVLASSLAAAALAGALIYSVGSRPDSPGPPAASRAVEVIHPEATQRQPTSSAETEPNVSALEPTEGTVAQDAQSPNPPADDRATRRRSGPPRDEATVFADLRKHAIQDIQQSYSLLLDDLDLTPEEREDLVAVLVELQVESAWSGSRDGEYQKRGRTIGPQERHERIAAAIGDAKLDEFLLLEQNSSAYAETQQIASLLRRKDAPLTETQRERMFEILVEVRDRYPMEPPAELASRSVEYIDHRMRQLDDFDRHVVELAPSVLSATQVAHLFEAYQRMSRERTDFVEMQKKRRAERPDEDVGWMYPARWNPR
jgi:hypothetical protein